MRRSLFDKYILIIEGLLGFTLVTCIIMAFTGDAKEIPLTLGVMGIICFTFIFLLSFVYNDSPQEQQKLDVNYYTALVKLSEENPKQFNKEYKRLIGHGTRYIILLFVIVVLSLEVIIGIGVAINQSICALGIFAASLIYVLYTIIT